MPNVIAAPMRLIGRYPLLAMCAVGLVLRLGLVFALPFEVRADEIFQYAEPAHRLLTGDGIITWEWRIGLRSWLLPGVIAGLMALSATLGLGHSLVFVQAVFAAFSILLIVVAASFGNAVAGRRGALICTALVAAWPAPVIFASRTLTEAQGGTLLAIGTLWAATFIARRRAPGPVSSFLIGLTLMLGTVLRIQFAPACGMALVGCVVAWRTSRPAMVCLLMGVTVPAFLSGLVDLMTLGSLFESSIRNFSINYVQHKADAYGIRSGFYYVGKIASYWGGMTLIVAGLAAFSFRGTQRAACLFILCVIAGIVLPHSAIPHKQFSFIYPALPLILILAGVGLSECLAIAGRCGFNGHDATLSIAISATGLLVFSGNYLTRLRPRISAYEASLSLYKHRDACGFGQYGPAYAQWSMTGGYTWLDRSVPIYYSTTPTAVTRDQHAFNYLLAQDVTLPSLPKTFTVKACIRHYCILKRPGGCSQGDVEPINATLRRIGE